MARSNKEMSDYNAQWQAEKAAKAHPELHLQCSNEDCNRVWKDHPDRQFCHRCGCRGESMVEEVILTGDEAIRAYREGRRLTHTINNGWIDINDINSDAVWNLNRLIIGNHRWKVEGISSRRELKW